MAPANLKAPVANTQTAVDAGLTSAGRVVKSMIRNRSGNSAATRILALGMALALFLAVVHVLLHHHHDGADHMDCSVCVVKQALTAASYALAVFTPGAVLVSRYRIHAFRQYLIPPAPVPYFPNAPPASL